MTPAVLVVVAAGGLGGAVQDQLGGGRAAPEPLTVQSAIGTIKRLAAAIPADRPELPAKERAQHRAQKERLDSLVIFIEKTHEVIRIGKATSQDQFNLLQVTRDVVDAGVQLSALPEEALVWQRAGLNLATAQYVHVYTRVQAGIDPPQTLTQARAQVELFRAQYLRAREKCTAPAFPSDR